MSTTIRVMSVNIEKQAGTGPWQVNGTFDLLNGTIPLATGLLIQNTLSSPSANTVANITALSNSCHADLKLALGL